MLELVDKDGLEAALEESKTRPVFLFKHSTACPISSAAHREVERYAGNGAEDNTPVYMVKVIESRPVSNEIASATGVEHKSPQLILVSDGKGVWSASHYEIDEATITKKAAESR